MAILRDNQTDEAMDACIALLSNVLDKCEAKWNDGRTSIGKGAGKTAADFYMLGWMTSHYENEAQKHDKIKNALKEKLAQCPNVNRVMDEMKALCREQIDALAPIFV